MKRSLFIALAFAVGLGGVGGCSNEESQVSGAPQGSDTTTAHSHSSLPNPFASHSGSADTRTGHGNSGDRDAPAGKPSSTSPALAPSPPPEPVELAKVSADSNGFSWEPTHNNYSSLQVRVSGPNGVSLEKQFKNGEPTQVYQALPDGVYQWEAVTQPEVPDWARDRMRKIRESGDITAERKLLNELRQQGVLPTEGQARNNVQSGTVTIRNGVMVVPDENPSRMDRG